MTRSNSRITPCALPEGSRIIQTVPNAHFSDCWPVHKIIVPLMLAQVLAQVTRVA